MIHVGTSGWQYAHWRGIFYPKKLSQRQWLAYYAERFQTVEVNNTFYNLPEKSVFAHWSHTPPDDFVFALKMSRYLTHLKRLHDPEEPVRRFMERAEALGRKRGPILLQLGPKHVANVDLLDAALDAFPKSERVAVEFRHPSWFDQATRELLERRGVALCLADRPRRKQPDWRTTSWGFVRFHEGRGAHAPGYGRDTLRRWVEKIAGLWSREEDVFVYFNNDTLGYAIKDAITFAELAATAGLRPTRVPAAAAA